MTRKIFWLNPVGTSSYDEPVGTALRAEAAPDTRIDVGSLPMEGGPEHLEFNAYEMVTAPGTVGAIRWAEQAGYDAAVLGCFYDPAFRAALEITDRMAVTAPAQASLMIANSLGERVSIIVGRRKWIAEMHERVTHYGFADRLAGYRSLDIAVPDLQRDPAFTEKQILREAQRAVEEDGADVIVLGCTIQFGFYRQVQDELGVPVIDALVAPLRYAEFLCDIRRSHGWGTSKAGSYVRPDSAELDAWVPVVEPVLSLDPRPTPTATTA